MTVDEAIELLKAEKAAGVKSIIVAWWQADMFDRADDEAWEQAADTVEHAHDWSATQEALAMTLNLYMSE